jgi:hypothetical protein
MNELKNLNEFIKTGYPSVGAIGEIMSTIPNLTNSCQQIVESPLGVAVTMKRYDLIQLMIQQFYINVNSVFKHDSPRYRRTFYFQRCHCNFEELLEQRMHWGRAKIFLQG